MDIETRISLARNNMLSTTRRCRSLIKAARPHFEGYSETRTLGRIGISSVGDRRSGITLAYRDSRILYDHHQLGTLDTFLLLSEQFRKLTSSRAAVFIYRPLGTVGITQGGITFSKTLNADEVQRYRLLTTLVSLLELYPQEKYVKQFTELFGMEMGRLSLKEKKDILDANKRLRDAGNRETQSLLAPVKHLQDLENRLFKKLNVPQDPIFAQSDILKLYHNFSSTLHGNHVSIREALDLGGKQRRTFRSILWLTLSTLYFAQVVVVATTDKKLITSFKSVLDTWLLERDLIASAMEGLRLSDEGQVDNHSINCDDENKHP